VTDFFRYEDPWYANGLPYLRRVPVLKETPKGWWLDDWGKRRFALKDARKRFAHPTEVEARTSYAARKARQISILTARLGMAQRSRAWALSEQAPGNVVPFMFFSDEDETP